MTAEEERARRVVGAVVRAALRETGRDGLVVAAPPDARGALLGRWIGAWGLEAAPPAEVAEVARSLAAGAPDDAGPEHHRAAARILAGRRNLLPVHPIDKTSLLLGGAPPPEPLLPLGDLWASELAPWCGEPPPPPLPRLDAGAREAVDRALARHLEERLPWERAARALEPEVATAVQRALERGRWHRLWAPVVPKLGPRTPGIDLDL